MVSVWEREAGGGEKR